MAPANIHFKEESMGKSEKTGVITHRASIPE